MLWAAASRRAGWFRESFLRRLVRAFQGTLAAIGLHRNPSWRTRNQAWEKGVSDGVWQSRCPVVCQEAAQEQGVSAARRGTGTEGSPGIAQAGCRHAAEYRGQCHHCPGWTSDHRRAASVHRRFVTDSLRPRAPRRPIPAWASWRRAMSRHRASVTAWRLWAT